jgi:hypothetical protein
VHTVGMSLTAATFAICILASYALRFGYSAAAWAGIAVTLGLIALAYTALTASDFD